MNIKKNYINLSIIFLMILLICLLFIGITNDKKTLENNKKEAEEYNNKIYSDKKLKEEETNKLIQSLPVIQCWGDGLTAGIGGKDISYPKILSNLLNNKVKIINFGIGGETTTTIASRQGAINMMVNNITIPSNVTPVKINNTTDGIATNFNDRESFPLKQGDGYVNQCSISDIEGKLTMNQSAQDYNSVEYFFTRNVPGEEVVITEDTPIITNAMNEKFTNSILIIWIGTNGEYDDIQDYLNQIDNMIKYANTDQYIIIPKRNATSDIIDAFTEAYGNKVIDVEKYIITNGFTDSGLTATSKDQISIDNGTVPPQFLSDYIHYNSIGYRIIGKLVYEKILELNYFNDQQKQYIGIN